MQKETENHERSYKVRVDVNDALRRALIELADARDVQEQMRNITARLGGTIAKVGEDETTPRVTEDGQDPRNE